MSVIEFLSLLHYDYPVSKCVEKSIIVSNGAFQCVIYILKYILFMFRALVPRILFVCLC